MLARSKSGVGAIVRNISWGVLPLVAGLFVLVQALEKTGVTQHSLNTWRILGGALMAAGIVLIAAF